MSKKSKYFVRVEDQKFIRNVEAHGEPRDQGIFKELISKEISNDLYLGIGWLKPGEIHILHHHPKASEFYYAVEGSAKITVNDETVIAEPGTAAYIPAGAKHKIVNDRKETFVVLFGYNYPEYVSIWDE